jgi:hypothetical protein
MSIKLDGVEDHRLTIRIVIVSRYFIIYIEFLPALPIDDLQKIHGNHAVSQQCFSHHIFQV